MKLIPPLFVWIERDQDRFIHSLTHFLFFIFIFFISFLFSIFDFRSAFADRSSISISVSICRCTPFRCDYRLSRVLKLSPVSQLHRTVSFSRISFSVFVRSSIFQFMLSQRRFVLQCCVFRTIEIWILLNFDFEFNFVILKLATRFIFLDWDLCELDFQWLIWCWFTVWSDPSSDMWNCLVWGKNSFWFLYIFHFNFSWLRFISLFFFFAEEVF